MRPLLAALALAGAQPALADDISVLRGDLAALHIEDARLQSIGWKLARSNADFCPDPLPSTGLLLLDARSFGAPDQVRAALRLTGEFAIDAVAAGSPAARAGLQSGDEVLAIEGLDFAALPAVPPNSFARLTALTTRIEALVGSSGALTVEVRAPGGPARRVAIAAEPVCRSRFELLTGGDKASADGQRVTISRRFLAAAPSDDEAAFVVAHELAHNILRHGAFLSKIGRDPANVRQTERAADRLALWLMINAGYDTAKASEFMARWARRRGPLLFADSTHDGWKTRQRTIAAELAVMSATPAKSPPPLRDWRPLFPR